MQDWTRNYLANTIIMESSNILILKSTGNEELKCCFSNVYGVNILRIETNFNTILHKRFAYECICSIPGIRIVTGIQMDTKTKGAYSFVLSKQFDSENIKSELHEKLKNYFIDF